MDLKNNPVHLSGHGYLDLISYEKYFQNELHLQELTCEEIEDAISKIELPV
jgi:hypothetical protein